MVGAEGFESSTRDTNKPFLLYGLSIKQLDPMGYSLPYDDLLTYSLLKPPDFLQSSYHSYHPKLELARPGRRKVNLKREIESRRFQDFEAF
jgi:hypothetical protein